MLIIRLKIIIIEYTRTHISTRYDRILPILYFHKRINKIVTNSRGENHFLFQYCNISTTVSNSEDKNCSMSALNSYANYLAKLPRNIRICAIQKSPR